MTSVREIFEPDGVGPAPEGDAAAREWLAGTTRSSGQFIAGGWTKPA